MSPAGAPPRALFATADCVGTEKAWRNARRSTPARPLGLYTSSIEYQVSKTGRSCASTTEPDGAVSDAHSSQACRRTRAWSSFST